MNDVTIFAGIAGILLLLAVWARSGRARRDARRAAQLAVGSAVSVANGSGGAPWTGFNFEAPTSLGDDLTLAPVSTLSLRVVDSRSPEGPSTGEQFALSAGVNTLGRAPTGEPQVHPVAIAADRAISTNHLYIETGANGHMVLTDRNSRNGTRLNGRHVEPETPTDLKVGDLLTIGNTTLQLEREGEETLAGMIRVVAKYRFRVLTGRAKDQVWEMNADRFRLGRSQESDWRLPDDQISRVHAEVQREGELVRIVDQGSANGLLVNDRRYQSRVLDPGDIIKVGNTEIQFERTLG